MAATSQNFMMSEILSVLRDDTDRKMFLQQIDFCLKNLQRDAQFGNKIVMELAKIESIINREKVIQNLAEYLKSWSMFPFLFRHISEITKIDPNEWNTAINFYSIRRCKRDEKYLLNIIALSGCDDITKKLILWDQTAHIENFTKIKNDPRTLENISVMRILSQIPISKRSEFIILMESEFPAFEKGYPTAQSAFFRYMDILSHLTSLEWDEFVGYRKCCNNDILILEQLSKIPREERRNVLDLIQPMICRGDSCSNVIIKIMNISPDIRQTAVNILIPFISNYSHACHYLFFEVAAKINDINKLAEGICRLDRLKSFNISAVHSDEILLNFAQVSLEATNLAIELFTTQLTAFPEVIGKLAKLIYEYDVECFKKDYLPITNSEKFVSVVKEAHKAPTLFHKIHILKKLDMRFPQILDDKFIQSLGPNFDSNKLDQIIEKENELKLCRSPDKLKELIRAVYKNDRSFDDIIYLTKLFNASLDVNLMIEIARIPSQLVLTVLGDAKPFCEDLEISDHSEIVRFFRETYRIRHFILSPASVQIRKGQTFNERIDFLERITESLFK